MHFSAIYLLPDACCVTWWQLPKSLLLLSEHLSIITSHALMVLIYVVGWLSACTSSACARCVRGTCLAGMCISHSLSRGILGDRHGKRVSCLLTPSLSGSCHVEKAFICLSPSSSWASLSLSLNTVGRHHPMTCCVAGRVAPHRHDIFSQAETEKGKLPLWHLPPFHFSSPSQHVCLSAMPPW